MITGFYAGLFALFYIALAFYVIGFRRRNQISLSDGGHDELLHRMRMHGNFAEYVPFALILLFIIEFVGYAGWIIHGLAITMLMARLAHAYALKNKNTGKPRFWGMVMTFMVLMISALLLIWNYVSQAFGFA